MKYYSTNHQAPPVNLSEAVIKGLAPDRGLYMPEKIHPLPSCFFDHIEQMTLQEIAFEVAKNYFGEDIDETSLEQIVHDTLSFDIPLVRITPSIFSLELFHGPTAAFKDVGARFMARLLSYFISRENNRNKKVHVLVATSGDTGSAVANGFLGVPGIDVCVLYPQGKVSEIQEKQFTTLGQNIVALEVDGTFDDCQRLVKSAFMDDELNRRFFLTSANSINVARFLPQSFYYFYAYAQYKKLAKTDPRLPARPTFCVPSGNFGNITAGLFATQMGLPVARFIAANNRNDIFLHYLNTGTYTPRQSIPTIANAMDVGDPSNFARILDLFETHDNIAAHISAVSYTDDQIRAAIAQCHTDHKYTLDPHGACGYQALKETLQGDEAGIFLETAHPCKFKEVVESVVGPDTLSMPETLSRFMIGEKQTVQISSSFEDFKNYMLYHFV